jgi:hypothetical protein
MVFRANVEEMDRLYQQTHRLGLDPRWNKTKLAAKDVSKLAVLITGLQQLYARASKLVEAEPADDCTAETAG